MIYYHINHNIFTNGDIIQCGAMGDIINRNYILTDTVNQQSLVWRMFQEQTFELIRVKEFLEKPSRYKSIFLFDSLEEVNQFIKRDERDGTNIYEIEILNKTKNIHKASMKLYERIPLGRPVYPAIEDQARQYWEGINVLDPPHDFRPEIIVESNVKVVRKISTNESFNKS